MEILFELLFELIFTPVIEIVVDVTWNILRGTARVGARTARRVAPVDVVVLFLAAVAGWLWGAHVADMGEVNFPRTAISLLIVGSATALAGWANLGVPQAWPSVLRFDRNRWWRVATANGIAATTMLLAFTLA